MMVAMGIVHRLLLLALVVGAAAVAGCGGATTPTITVPRAATPPPSGGLDPHVLPPKSIPTQPTGRADPDAIRVIRAWARDIRLGRITAAAKLFAFPARFQNGTPVLTLHDRIDVLAVTAGFTCGAVVTRFASAGFYTLVRFRLTSRVGGDCHGGEGTTTGGAIRVVHGHIRAWYRLYDPEEILPPTPGTDPNDIKA
jgi:hypothetical protein